MKQDDVSTTNNEVLDLQDVLKERYLAYALSTIMHRALPDVRDGLKPVHRRIIYAMYLLRLNPNQSYAKCARIVGDVMGKFHPHGDNSIYDALVRLAQDFSMRYPLIDGQGNFGNIDGDNAAAMRYTEARMTETASLLLKGLAQDAVDFQPTYNEEDLEPVVLPALFPNILANGATGIAVGMATSIPPHNIVELCNACVHLIKNPEAENEDLLEYVKGPDFPTGGVLLTTQAEIKNAYETGKGSFRLRAKWHKEAGERGSYLIIITEIPFQIQKNKLISKLQELVYAKKLPLIEDIRDESAEDIRVVIEPKSRSCDAEIIMESLFKISDFEVRIPLNMNVLTHGKIPNVLSLRDVLQQWLNHRCEVLQRCSAHRLANLESRLEIVEGYLIAHLNIDEVIAIIREYDEPKAELIARFSLTDNQAEAILNIKLRSLRKLEELELRREQKNLEKEQKDLQKLLNSPKIQWQYIADEISELAEKYTKQGLGERKTIFGEAPKHDVSDIEQAMIEKEPITIVLSEKGWIRALKGHNIDGKNLSYKDNDSEAFLLRTHTTDKVLLCTTGGKVYTINIAQLPGGRGHGDPIRLLVDIDNNEDIIALVCYSPKQKMIIASKQGYGFIVEQDDLLSTTKKGKQIMNVKAPDSVACLKEANGGYLAIIGENRRMLIVQQSEIPNLRRGKGVRLQKYKSGGLSDVASFNAAEGLKWQDSSGRIFTKPFEELEEWRLTRAAAGRMAPKGFPKNNKFD